jgi:hypothetical protein
MRRLAPHGTFSWHDLWLIFLLALVVGSDYLQAVQWLGEDQALPKVLFFVSTGLMLVWGWQRLRPFPQPAAAMVWLWILFALATFTSTMVNGPNRLPALWYLVGIPLLVFNLLPMLLGQRSNLIIAWSLILPSIFFTGWSVLIFPLYFGTQQYKGVFGGTPTMSTVAAMMVMGALTLLGGLVTRPRVSKLAVAGLSLILFFGFMVVISTAYRTVIASCLIMVLITVVSRLQWWRNILRVATVTGLLAMVLVVGAVASGHGSQLRFWEAAVAKQKDKTTGHRVGGVWSFRDTEWRFMLANATLLGHSYDFSKKAPVTQSYHSPYTMILGQYGIIAVLFFIAFWLVSLYPFVSLPAAQ